MRERRHFCVERLWGIYETGPLCFSLGKVASLSFPARDIEGQIIAGKIISCFPLKTRDPPSIERRTLMLIKVDLEIFN